MSAREYGSKLLSFTISRPDQSDNANGLYANGNHQCEVYIEVVKQVRTKDNTWISAALTDKERSSVAIVEWSEQDSDELPRGWFCDEQRNEYDLGLWAKDPVSKVSGVVKAERASDPHVERIRRYLRCETGQAMGPLRFMARIVIDGKIYTTHFSESEVVFESSITIDSVHPYYLGVEDLEESVGSSAFFAYNSSGMFLGNVYYYWPVKPGLKFVKNSGFGDPLGLPGDGDAFDSALSQGISSGGVGFRFRAGTLTNKNQVDDTLKIKEVYQGAELPDADAPVKFDKEKTIMRAVWFASNTLDDPEHQQRKPWKLLDNFGTEHTFTLAGDDKGNLSLRDASEVGSLRLDHFEIMTPGGQTSSDELYSNGRHQCQIEVEVVVFQMRPDGSSVQVKLTDAQRDSLTITRFSINPDEPLPRGWSCDKEKNIYDLGRRRVGAEGAGLCQDAEKAAAGLRHPRRGSDAEPDPEMEVVIRYLRVDSSAASEKVRFMAAIEIEGNRFTTNYVEGDISFTSYVTVGFETPYKVPVSELLPHIDLSAYEDKYCDIDVYYWSHPTLKMVVNRGIDSPVFYAREGDRSTSSYVLEWKDQHQIHKGGIVYGKDVLNPTVFVSDILKDHPEGSRKVVRFNERATIMRAVKCRIESAVGTYADHRSKWRLWDNYGCEQVYIIEAAFGGDRLTLQDF
ncbi:hypothetical protein C4J96_1010 [Pseudomonas orientalis]|uniref:hypothetical protein n=1 Tax=Pseudomonas orientalis TaxID=76758 RepID=UPI000F56BB99|nr:hypothetical protein [Pseudomonas orientalis]AZE93144.1 hypothetical protein C4J96_1010 [Pseudomonas orientalis]